MRKVKRKYNKIEKFYKFITVTLIIFILVSPFLIVFSQASLAKINLELEKKKIELNKQKKKNDSLEMKIDELASLKEMKQVAIDKGLKYNNSNIIRISSSR